MPIPKMLALAADGLEHLSALQDVLAHPAVQQELAALQGQLQDREQQLQGLQQQLQEQEQQLRSVQEQLQDAHAQLQHSQVQHAAQQAQLAEANKTRADAAAELAACQQSLADAQQQLAAAQAAAGQQAAAAAEAEQQLRQQVAAVQASAETKESRIMELRAALGDVMETKQARTLCAFSHACCLSSRLPWHHMLHLLVAIAITHGHAAQGVRMTVNSHAHSHMPVQRLICNTAFALHKMSAVPCVPCALGRCVACACAVPLCAGSGGCPR